MFLSSVNIFSDSCAALIIAKSEGNSGFFITKKTQNALITIYYIFLAWYFYQKTRQINGCQQSAVKYNALFSLPLNLTTDSGQFFICMAHYQTPPR